MTRERGFPNPGTPPSPPEGVPTYGNPPEPPDRFRRSEGVPGLGTPRNPGVSGGGFPPPPLYRRDPPDAQPRSCRWSGTKRVLPGRHHTNCPRQDDGTCLGCEPCPRPHCRTCRKEHATNTCPRCLGRARTNLAAIVTLNQALPTHATNGRQAYHHHADDIPGGDATVMLTPATTHRPDTQPKPTTDQPGDVRPPLDVLAHWCARWGNYRPTGAGAAQLTDAARYLNGQLNHIAQHLWFRDLAADLADTVTTLETVLHAGNRPDVSRVPCLSCGARLHRVWTDQPDRDHWRCPVCAQTYNHGRYERAKHDHLASRGAERYVPLLDAAAAIGRPHRTIRTWVADGTVTARRTTTGRVEVWWPHVREKHLTTPTRRRRTNDPEGRTA